MIKLMFITADASVATTVMNADVDRVFVDMEVIGKSERQGGMNTVQSKHSFDDLRNVKSIMPLDKELLVRSNPIHDGLASEVDAIIEAGADIVMLPFFYTANDVRRFVEMVGGRCRVMILIENKESAIDNIDDILAVEGVDEYYVGLNDLNLSLGGKFMFEPMANGILDEICGKLRKTGKPFGFGGIARLDGGLLSGDKVLAEHYRLGSSMVILSRSFCNVEQVSNLSEMQEMFESGVGKLRELENEYKAKDSLFFTQNSEVVKSLINSIVNG